MLPIIVKLLLINCLLFTQILCSEPFILNDASNVPAPIWFKLIRQIVFRFYTPIEGVNNIECKAQSEIYYDQLMNNQQWALTMYDSSGKLPEALYSGNKVDLGLFDQCLSIKTNINDSITIRGQYCLPKIQFTSTNNYLLNMIDNTIQVDLLNEYSHNYNSSNIHWAVCVPDVCTSQDVQDHLNYMFENTFNRSYEAIVNDLDCSSQLSEPKMNIYDWLMICFLICTGLVIISQTCYEYYLKYTNQKSLHPLLLSFSLITNIEKLSYVNRTRDQFHCLYGLRWFSMMWVILGHRYSFNAVDLTFINRIDLLAIKNSWLNYLPLGGMVAVDTFFVMSGMLTMYLLLKTLNTNKKFNIFLLYLHRYLRLTPPLLVMLLFVLTLSKLIGSGPFWKLFWHNEHNNCVKSWWALLLYIQNYMPVKNICLVHTWYLSSDTQMFLLAPSIIYIVYKLKHKYWSYSFLIGLTILFTLITYIICIHYNINAAYITINMKYFHLYYFPMHTRISTYLIGLLLGYIMFLNRNKSIRINSKLNIVLWLICIVTMLSILLCQYPMNQDGYERANILESFYLAFHRVLWSIALSWIIFACSFGYGGPINWLLTRPIFQILSRITYCMYLVHFSLLLYRTGSMKSAHYFNNTTLFYTYISDLLVVMIVGTIWTLAFEMPWISIETYLFADLKKPKSSLSTLIKKNTNINLLNNDLSQQNYKEMSTYL